MRDNRKVAITFDIDFVKSAHDLNFYNELETFAPKLLSEILTQGLPNSTWFFSLDERTTSITGSNKFAFETNQSFVSQLRNSGQKIAWHYHPYVRNAHGDWIKPNKENLDLESIVIYAELAQRVGLDVSRIGWGVMNNEIMGILMDSGFRIDSTCIPRPKYSWSYKLSDWSDRDCSIYSPCRMNYQRHDEAQRSLVEIPISTSIYEKSTDTESKVIRYLNIANPHKVFVDMLDQVKSDTVVTISHPYEFFVQSKNGEYRFNSADLIKNLDLLKARQYSFVGISDL